MTEYRIIDAEWVNYHHDTVMLRVQTVEEDVVVNEFSYTSNAIDEAPMNQLLWGMVQEDTGIVRQNEREQIILGIKPVPEGFRIINQQLYNTAVETAKARQAIDRRLNELYTGRSLARAERDPVYAANRQAHIDILLDLENQPEFPYFIIWPEDVEE